MDPSPSPQVPLHPKQGSAGGGGAAWHSHLSALQMLLEEAKFE